MCAPEKLLAGAGRRNLLSSIESPLGRIPGQSQSRLQDSPRQGFSWEQGPLCPKSSHPWDF